MSRKGHNEVSDADRRKRQAERIVRILTVHKESEGPDSHSKDRAELIASKLGVSVRTIWRDFATLRLLYETLGTEKLDPEFSKK